MSTIKADAVTAVSTNADLSLDGLGTGGVSIASTLKMTKGGDISSASPLVIDTDGNYFDVTGTTNFAAMTVESGNFFMLQFDGVITVTDGSDIVLPGNANVTTAAGDVWTCYATSANTVVVTSIETTAATSAGPTRLTEQATTSGTTKDFTIPTGAIRVTIQMIGVSTNGTDAFLIQLGDSSGVDTSGYESVGTKGGTSLTDQGVGLAWGAARNAASLYHGRAVLEVQSASNFIWTFDGMMGDTSNNDTIVAYGVGSHTLTSELTTVRLTTPTPNTFDAGLVDAFWE